MSAVCPAPGCSGRLVDGECERCGAMPPAQGRRDRRPPKDGRCAYTYQGNRCTYTGVMSDSRAGAWYCRYHHTQDGRLPGPEQDAFFSQQATPGGRADQVRKWRRHTPADLVAEMIDNSPQWRRQLDESMEDYVQRIRADAHAKARRFLARSDEMRGRGE